MEIVQCNDNHSEMWNELVPRSPQGSLYHRFEWRTVNATCFGHRSAYLAALEEGRIVGILPVVQVKSQFFGNIACSLPFVNYAGPAGDTDAIERALVDGARPVADAWRVDYLELRTRRRVESLPTSEHKVSMTLDLDPDPDVLFKKFSTAHRQDIRGGYKKGLIARIGGSELLDDFYAVLSESWRDMGTPIYSRRYLQTVASTFPQWTRLCVVYAGQEPAAAALDMLAGDTVEGLWLGSRGKFRRQHAGYVLYLGADQERLRTRPKEVPPGAFDDGVRRRGLQEEVERLSDAALLAVPAAQQARHPSAERRQSEVPAGNEGVAEAAGAHHPDDRAAHREEHSVSSWNVEIQLTMALRHVAPAGAPIRLMDLTRAAGLAVAGGDVHETLRRAICSRFGMRHSFLTSTGRAGMTLLLKAFRRLAPPALDEVVLPSYTCYSVAASVLKAGLRPRLVDISPETLDYDRDRLVETDFTRVLAIVATNLYGLPNDLPWLNAFARRHGAFLVDDAAQCMGGAIGGRKSGTWGDAGLFSFDKGKNVSAIDGGVVITNSDSVADALAAELKDLHGPGLGESSVAVMKAVAYSVLLRPWLYWIPNRIPHLSLGKTVFTTKFPLDLPSRPLTALGVSMMPRLDEFTLARVSNAAALIESLQALRGVKPIAPIVGATPVYLRLPILLNDEAAKHRSIAMLSAAGIGATGSYPESLADVAELRDRLAASTRVLGGRFVAKHLVTLPTHAFVGVDDLRRTVRALAEATQASTPGGLNSAGDHTLRA